MITTSRFTTGARRFAEKKQLELIDGADLLSILGKVGIDKAVLVESEIKSRVFSPFAAVMEDLEDWKRTYSQPCPLEFYATATQFLFNIGCYPKSVIAVGGFWSCICIVNDEHHNWDTAELLCYAIDHLKALYLLTQDAEFLPETDAPSVPEVLLALLKGLCERFEKLERQEQFRQDVQDYISEHPHRDDGMVIALSTVEGFNSMLKSMSLLSKTGRSGKRGH